ncbi:hypothetical protein Lal_00042692 [Lupinus albus]|nr:hypothetical protein Lal_00042692 [Lupinus albus]
MNITESQFCFILGRSTIKAIYLLQLLMERYRRKQRDSHMVFIYLEKAYDNVSREFMWNVLDKKGLHQGLTLIPYLLTLVLRMLTKHIQEQMPQCILRATLVSPSKDTPKCSRILVMKIARATDFGSREHATFDSLSS